MSRFLIPFLFCTSFFLSSPTQAEQRWEEKCANYFDIQMTHQKIIDDLQEALVENKLSYEDHNTIQYSLIGIYERLKLSQSMNELTCQIYLISLQSIYSTLEKLKALAPQIVGGESEQ